jgi:hypothetical protein
MPSSHVVLDQVDITFDDQGSAASAGLLLPATLAERLGIEQVTDQVVDLGDRLGAAHPGRKLLTLVHARGDLPALGAARLYVGVVPRDMEAEEGSVGHRGCHRHRCTLAVLRLRCSAWLRIRAPGSPCLGPAVGPGVGSTAAFHDV